MDLKDTNQHLTYGLNLNRACVGSGLILVGFVLLFLIAAFNFSGSEYLYNIIPGWLVYLSPLLMISGGMYEVIFSVKSQKCSYCNVQVSVAGLYYPASHEFQVEKAIESMNVALIRYLPVSDVQLEDISVKLTIQYCPECELVAGMCLQKHAEFSPKNQFSSWVVKDSRVHDFIAYANEIRV